jgi:hypothetical protein
MACLAFPLYATLVKASETLFSPFNLNQTGHQVVFMGLNQKNTEKIKPISLTYSNKPKFKVKVKL